MLEHKKSTRICQGTKRACLYESYAFILLVISYMRGGQSTKKVPRFFRVQKKYVCTVVLFFFIGNTSYTSTGVLKKYHDLIEYKKSMIV